jgi:S-DNA-T family DNA segregation ATPase FtsK/SpoIIIE
MPPMALLSESRTFLSPALKARFTRYSAEIIGLFVALAGLIILVALASYHPGDPSFNTATIGPVRNLAGPFGADLADALLQGVGIIAVLPGLVLLAWSYLLSSKGRISRLRWRIVAALLAMPVLATALGAARALSPALRIVWPVPSGLGGAIGLVLGGDAVGAGGSSFGMIGWGLTLAASSLAGLALALYAFGLSPGEWRSAGRSAARAAKVSARHGRSAALSASRGAGNVSSWLAPILSAPITSPADEARHPAPAEAAGADDAFLNIPAYRPSQRESHKLEQAAPEAAMPDRLRPAAAKISARKILPNKPPQDRLPLAEAGWQLPPLGLLSPAPRRASAGRADTGPSAEALQGNARLLETVLQDYGVQGRIVEIRPGPVVTLYELEPAPGIRSARVIGLADDIARSLSVLAVRIATVQGRNVIGIEVPNAKRETVYLSELLGVPDWASYPGKLALALGKDISGAPVIADLARMPHLLIAGTTGSGKSVGVNAMILSLLYRLSPEQCRLIMIDPKMLELSVYEGIPHLLTPVVTEPAKAVAALKWVVREMERRYRAMSQLSVRNIAGYNDRVNEALARGEVVTRRVQTGFDPETGRPVHEDQPLALEALPLIVVFIDEMADLMMVAGKEIEAAVQRLAQMARAAGIHVIMATQRPSVDVITGTIKANFPTRISFQVISKFDSRTILGEQGSEQLLGQGDMLYMAGGGRITRVHGPFVSDKEVEDVVAFLREQGEPAYIEEVTEVTDDDGASVMASMAGAEGGEANLYQQAVALVVREGKASTSFIQRHLQIGYNRAAKLIEQMEKDHVVGPANHVGKREVLVAGGREE